MLTSITGINWGDEGKGRMVDLPAVVTPIVFPLLDDVVSCVAEPIVVNFEAESFELFLR